jgi:hypothetical protein
MAMKAAISEGDQSRSDEGGGGALAEPELGPIQEIKSFRILFEIWIFCQTLKFAQGDFDMMIFPKIF